MLRILTLTHFYQAMPPRTRETTTDEHADASTERTSETPAKPRRRRVQRKKTGDEGVSEEADANDDDKRPLRRAARKGPPEDGTPSITTIYVANIPFEYTDEKVRKSFLPLCFIIPCTDSAIAKRALRSL